MFYDESVDEYGRKYLRIIHADIIINDYDYDFSTDPNDPSTYYFGTLILHELGHILGLPHIKDGIMTNNGMDLEEKRIILNESEISTVISKYSSPVQGSSQIRGITFELTADPVLKRVLFYFKPLTIN